MERNFELNQEVDSVAKCGVTTVLGDAYVGLANLVNGEERFDIVVVDPPSFAQKQASVEGAYAPTADWPLWPSKLSSLREFYFRHPVLAGLPPRTLSMQ